MINNKFHINSQYCGYKTTKAVGTKNVYFIQCSGQRLLVNYFVWKYLSMLTYFLVTMRKDQCTLCDKALLCSCFVLGK